MAGNVPNFKGCSPLKLHSGLTGKCHAICYYSYNLPLAVIRLTSNIRGKSLKYLKNGKLGGLILIKICHDLVYYLIGN